MSRLFNTEVFNGSINGGGSNPSFYSDPNFNALLGTADVIRAQVFIDGCTATGSVHVNYQTSNTGEEGSWEYATIGTSPKFEANANAAPGSPVSVTSFVIGPDNTLYTSGVATLGFQNGSFGRFVLQYVPTSGDGVAAVRIVACGRTT